VRISRIFTAQDLNPDSSLLLEEKSSHYLTRVLKLRAGDPLVVFNGDGFDYAAEISSINRKLVELSVSAKLPAAAESKLQITLVQAISRGERMDLTLQKATELGVSAIRPLLTERVEVKLDQKRTEKRMVHWRGVVISACEQSGRAKVPEVFSPGSLDDWLALESDAQRLVLEPQAEQSLAGQTFSNGQLELLVGPEGGFSENELRKLKIGGVKAVSLGPRVLRTETAGPAAIAVLQSIAGDF
jgi:16S rRNA (uracil1498-N3)-methyltransferase